MAETHTGTQTDAGSALITTGDAAEMLSVTPGAVRKMAERGHLPYEQKLPGKLGSYLFRRDKVLDVARRRLEEEAARLQDRRARLDGVAS
jgi:excisionase family DNA binding protein